MSAGRTLLTHFSQRRVSPRPAPRRPREPRAWLTEPVRPCAPRYAKCPVLADVSAFANEASPPREQSAMARPRRAPPHTTLRDMPTPPAPCRLGRHRCVTRRHVPPSAFGTSRLLRGALV